MKKLIFTTLLTFFMLFGLHSQNVTQRDSVNNFITTKVEVAFKNPQLDVSISDQRDKEYIDIFAQVLNDNLSTNTLLEGTLTKTNSQLAEILQIRKEEGSMSAMDYLIQKTNLKEQEIQNMINRHQHAIKISYIFTFLLFIGIYISYVFENNKRKRNWGHSLIKGITLVLLLYLMFPILQSILSHMIASDYIYFENLIQLTT